jgi:peptidoglycan hydrolase-like protein with peptidoglycan-binding domain
VAPRASHGRKAAITAEAEVVEADGLVARLADRVFDNPAMSGGLLAMALTAAAIVSNAMFLQSTRHPQPLFMTRPAPDLMDPATVPLPRSRAERTGSIAPAAAVEPPLPRLQPAQRVATAPAPVVDRGVITDLQRLLAERGLYKGAIDGISGSRTRAAISAYQKSEGLPVTGQPSTAVLDHIRTASVAVAASPPAKAPAAPAPAVAAAPAAPPPAKPVTRVAAAPAPPAEIPVAAREIATAPTAPEPAAAPPPIAFNPPAEEDLIASMVDEPFPATGPAVPAEPAAAPSVAMSDAAPPAEAVAPPHPAAAPVVEIVPVSARPVAAAPSPAPSAGASARYAAVQRALNNIGYGPVVESGVVDDATADAIRRFELDNGLPLTGRPEDRVVNRLISIGAMEAI